MLPVYSASKFLFPDGLEPGDLPEYQRAEVKLMELTVSGMGG